MVHRAQVKRGKKKWTARPPHYDTYRSTCQTYDHVKDKRRKKTKKHWMTARPPTDTYRGKLATPKASNCMPRLGSCSPRAEDAKVYGYCTFGPPTIPHLPHHRTQWPSRKGRAVFEGDHANSIRQRNPRIAVRQSKPRSRVTTSPQTITLTRLT